MDIKNIFKKTTLQTMMIRKKILVFLSQLFFLLVFSLSASFACAEAGVAQGPYIVNVRNLTADKMVKILGVKELHQHQVIPNTTPANVIPLRLLKSPDPGFPLTTLSPLPAIDFLGHDQSGWNPPDTNGAISDTFVLTTVNNDTNIRDRNGALLAAFNLDVFWQITGTTGNSFDTRSRFDPYAERFIIMSAGALGDAPNSSILLAVSQTSDPTGNWNLYRIPVDPDGLHWVDYPTIGFNAKWIVVHGNLFPLGNANFTTALWAFNKASIYAGGSGFYTVLPGIGATTQPAETYDPSVEDLYLLQQPSNDAVSLYRLSGAVGFEATELVATVLAPQTWTGNIPSAPQLGSDVRIFPGLNWMMDCVYRNGAIWGTQVVEPIAGPARTAAQWWRISTTGELLDFGRIDDPTGTIFYGFPSIAVNADNDALIGYTQFSASIYPSAGYSLRMAADPAGTFRSGVMYESGVTPFGSSRWGDFSHTQVDPLNDKDFWTVQEITGNFGWSTWWANVKVESTTEAKISLRLKSAAPELTNSPHPQLRVTNDDSNPLTLSNVTLRYWLNCDCNPPATTVLGSVDWAGILPAGQSVTPHVHILFEATALGRQTHVLVVSFDSTMPRLRPGETLDLYLRFNKPNWSTMQQANDWSYAAFNHYTQWDKITGYLNNILIYGKEP